MADSSFATTMAGPALSGDLLASTLNSVFADNSKAWDNWKYGLPFFDWLRENQKVGNHGYQIQVPVEYANNGNEKWMTGGTDTLTMTSNQIHTNAYYNPVFAAVSAVITILEEAQNAGNQTQLFDLFEARLENAMQSLFRLVTNGALAAATAANQIWSAYDIANASNPALGSLGGISRTTYTWWGAQNATISSFATTGIQKMYTMFASIAKSSGDLEPKLILSDYASQNLYIMSQDPKRIAAATDKTMDAGWKSNAIQFKGAKWIYDNYAQAGKILYLHEKFIKMMTYQMANFKPTPRSTKWDGFVFGVKIPWIGNLVTGAPLRLGQHTSVA